MGKKQRDLGDWTRKDGCIRRLNLKSNTILIKVNGEIVSREDINDPALMNRIIQLIDLYGTISIDYDDAPSFSGVVFYGPSWLSQEWEKNISWQFGRMW